MKKSDFLLIISLFSVLLIGCKNGGEDVSTDPVYPEAPNLSCIKIGDIWWAPVNCGYDATHPYGLLYQWGRHDGCGYNDGSTYTEDVIQERYATENTQVDGSVVKEDANYFYWGLTLPRYDWLTKEDDSRWRNIAENSKTAYDPCPSGWRVPTYAELNSLLGGNLEPSIVTVDGVNGCYFNGTKSCTSNTADSKVFLPTAGCRSSDDGSANHRGKGGSYWSSSSDGEYAWFLGFNTLGAGVYSDARALGFSVRCIKEYQPSYPTRLLGTWVNKNASSGYTTTLKVENSADGQQASFTMLSPTYEVTLSTEGSFVYDSTTGKGSINSMMVGSAVVTVYATPSTDSYLEVVARRAAASGAETPFHGTLSKVAE